jgi:hypothetical protein
MEMRVWRAREGRARRRACEQAVQCGHCWLSGDELRATAELSAAPERAPEGRPAERRS